MVRYYHSPNVTFRRDLFGARLTSWNTLLARLASIQLTQGSDEFRWNLCGNGKFSVEKKNCWDAQAGRTAVGS